MFKKENLWDYFLSKGIIFVLQEGHISLKLSKYDLFNLYLHKAYQKPIRCLK